VFVALFGLAAANATGCVQLNASHCANLQGTATCEERGAGVCSKCTSENDGCVQTVDADCAADIGATESGTTTESVTGSTTVGMSMSSTSVTSSTTLEPETGESTTMEMRMVVAAVCGDGVLNEGEECDGRAFAVEDCIALGWDEGELSCNQKTCLFDLSDCNGGEPPCGDGVREPGEACDGTDFGGETCESLHEEEPNPEGYGGTPYCTPGTCQIDPTTCCKLAGASCVALLPDDYSCCPGLSCNALAGNLGTCV
jgi:hypothetical protein